MLVYDHTITKIKKPREGVVDVGKWVLVERLNMYSVVPRESDLIREVAIAEGGIRNVTESDKYDEDFELLKI